MAKSFDQMTPEEIENLIDDINSRPTPDTVTMIDWDAIANDPRVKITIPGADVIEKRKKKAAFSRYANKIAELAGAPDNGTFIVCVNNKIVSGISVGGDLCDAQELIANVIIQIEKQTGESAAEIAQEIVDAIKEQWEGN